MHHQEHQNIVQSKPTLAELVADFIAADELTQDPTYVVRWTLRQFARNDFDTFDPSYRQQALDPAPPLTGHSGWDAFFAALADYLAQRDSLQTPGWVNQPERCNNSSTFYPANSHRPPELMAELITEPAPWFITRGVGLSLSELPSGQGKDLLQPTPPGYLINWPVVALLGPIVIVWSWLVAASWSPLVSRHARLA